MPPKPRAVSPRENIKEARRNIHRQHLLEAAERVFAERGYEGTRMQDVAAETGLALATVYGIFASKEELYTAIHAARGRELLERAHRATSGSGSAFEALRLGVAAYVEFLVEHPAYLALQLLESRPWALAPRFISEEQGAQWREGLALTVAVFSAAIAEGSIIDENPTTLARLMIATHQVFLGEWVEAGMKEPLASLLARLDAHLRRAFAVGPQRRRTGLSRL